MMGEYWTGKVGDGYAWAIALCDTGDTEGFKTTLISDQLYATEAEAQAAGSQKFNQLFGPPKA
jgi:hypothetical protein